MGGREEVMDLKHLGSQSEEAVDVLDVIPWNYPPTIVQIDVTEFTSHCPVTKHPDFGKLRISYLTDKKLAETKSLKLFLRRYRDRAQFNEVIVNELAEDLFRQLEPTALRVTGTFNLRGGIGVTAHGERGDVSLLPVPVVVPRNQG